VSTRPALSLETLSVHLAPADSLRTARTGMTLALAGIGMLFTSFTSAYVVRHGLDPDWQAMPMPKILVANTLVLLASSISLEKARRERGSGWLAATLILGGLFVAGQLTAWAQLKAAGVYFASTPHSSFFYLLTAAHGAHLAGGLAGFCVVAAVSGARRRRWLEVISLYWHFMGALWLYLLFLLFGVR